MTSYVTNFSEYTTGVQPSDWTARWTTTNTTWATRAKTGDTGGKSLENTLTAQAYRLLSWDDVDGDGSRADSEILVRVRASGIGADQFMLALRASGSGGSETAYLCHLTSATGLRISRIVAGTITTILSATLSFTVVGAEWYKIRFRVNGTALKAKIWPAEHDGNEPAAWTIETTDINIASAGWVGVATRANTATRDWDDVAIETGGGTAEFTISGAARDTQTVALILSSGPGAARVTQASMMVLAEEGTTEARVTQSALLVVYEPSPEARFTQGVGLVLSEFFAGANLTQQVALVLADQVACVSHWAQCWTITRQDGEVFAFTSHDQPMQWRGVEHTPCNSLMSTATEMSSITGSVGNMELRGIVSDDSITEQDMLNGLFDRATVEVWMVPWSPENGEIPFRLLAGTTGDLSHGQNEFNYEVLSPGAQLQQKNTVEIYTPGCRFEFGDDRCTFNAKALAVSGTVTAVPTKDASTYATRRAFGDSTRTEDPGYFALGKVTWVTGANAGVTREVKDFSSGIFVLWEPLLHEIQTGDEYVATPGCNKSPEACQGYGNYINFGGYPDVPGQDSIAETPDAKG